MGHRDQIFEKCWLFALTYLIIMTIASKKSIRYMMPAFPAFYLLAGTALYQTIQTLQSRKVSKFLPRTSALLLWQPRPPLRHLVRIPPGFVELN